MEKADFADSTARSISLRERQTEAVRAINNVKDSGDLRVRQDLLCRLGNLGDQLVGGWIEHINPPGQETQLSKKKIYSGLFTLPSSPYTMGSGDQMKMHYLN